MEIRIESLLVGARRAAGVVVVIDVFRAFTTASVAFTRGVDRIVMVAEPPEALALRARGVGSICVGEVDGKMPAGFDFGNSPHELWDADIAGKTLIQSTRAGTVGVTTVAANAEAIFAAALINARATAEAIRAMAPPLVTLVAMGYQGRFRADEDEQCALYLRALLEGRQPDRDAVRSLVLSGNETDKFRDPSKPYLHWEDVEHALRIDEAPVVIRVREESGVLVARKL
ncbi:MAG: 2-phosphosulfolactate phosphatase [Rhodothermales bacterium]|nr:2-phosphosulfolactate phosphatase [Rhodothermales bacterium]